MSRPLSGGYDYESVHPHSPLGTPFGGTPSLSRRGSFEYHSSPAASTTQLVRNSMNNRDSYTGGLQRLRPTLDRNHNTYSNGSQTNLSATEREYMIPEKDSFDDERGPYEEDSSTVIGSTPDLKHDRSRFSSTSSFGQKFNDTEYVISELAKHDDVDLLPEWKRRLHRMSPLFTIAALGGYYTYYAFRIYFTVEAQKKYDKVYAMAWVFIAAEFLVTGMSSVVSKHDSSKTH